MKKTCNVPTESRGVWEQQGATSMNPWAGLKNTEYQFKAGGVGSQQYDAFGNVVSSSAWTASPNGYGGPFGYQEDPDSGLKLLGHRYYDPDLGRFLSRDRVKHGRNWYVYCRSSPITRVDPTGLTWYYNQRTGELFWDNPHDGRYDPQYIGAGFSGQRGEHRNNPASQNLRDRGPLPRGRYRMGPRRSTKSNGRSLDNIVLTPEAENEMFDRSHFLIHPGRASGNPSQGCIIFDSDTLDLIMASGDYVLVVYIDEEWLESYWPNGWDLGNASLAPSTNFRKPPTRFPAPSLKW